ncbi:hypothetical protein B0H13DRAFT_1850786 [Mycena leptocephala]|nr:hypothetical protein B0H13DRAFT_1850786 [Mycena leptocephala]
MYLEQGRKRNKGCETSGKPIASRVCIGEDEAMLREGGVPSHKHEFEVVSAQGQPVLEHAALRGVIGQAGSIMDVGADNRSNGGERWIKKGNRRTGKGKTERKWTDVERIGRWQTTACGGRGSLDSISRYMHWRNELPSEDVAGLSPSLRCLEQWTDKISKTAEEGGVRGGGRDNEGRGGRTGGRAERENGQWEVDDTKEQKAKSANIPPARTCSLPSETCQKFLVIWTRMGVSKGDFESMKRPARNRTDLRALVGESHILPLEGQFLVEIAQNAGLR